MLADRQIAKLARETGMIDPFIGHTVRDIVSYGLSSYGYDIRIANTFKVFWPPNSQRILDPVNFDDADMMEIEVPDGQGIIIPANSFALGYTVEKFNIPRDIMTICVGKSTYARCGLIVNVTPFEPEWRGHATLELSNTTPNPVRVYAGQGIAQLIFLRGEELCKTSYADKKGKYQDQAAEIVLARKDL